MDELALVLHLRVLRGDLQVEVRGARRLVVESLDSEASFAEERLELGSDGRAVEGDRDARGRAAHRVDNLEAARLLGELWLPLQLPDAILEATDVVLQVQLARDVLAVSPLQHRHVRVVAEQLLRRRRLLLAGVQGQQILLFAAQRHAAAQRGAAFSP